MRRDALAAVVRRRLQRLPPPFAAHYGVVPLPPPADGISLSTVLPRLTAANAALVRIETLATELADPYLISRVLPRREAIASSSIEGTNSTLDELLLLEETSNEDVTAATALVRDYALTLEGLLPRARDEGPALFTSTLACELHRAVMRGDPDYQDNPGELRSRVVWVGGRDIAYSTYNPTPPADIAACLEQSMSYMRGEDMQAMRQGLIVRMAVAHAHFEAVHPFRDGNGRVGRLLLPLMMAAEGRVPLYLSPAIEARRAAYYAALAAAQQRLTWQEMVGFLADTIVDAADEVMATRAALSSLRELWRARRSFRRGSAALAALDLLPHYPVLTTRRLAALLGVSAPAASQAVAQLTAAGVLVERTGYARNRVFAAPEALSIVNRPFGAAPLVPAR
ncbi:MAG: Fic family protein [Hyphomicrobiales bacterium]|nr:Fic family protein [Hyphomicrobiales bacterium]